MHIQITLLRLETPFRGQQVKALLFPSRPGQQVKAVFDTGFNQLKRKAAPLARSTYPLLWRLLIIGAQVTL